jgi:hypothetical protein
MRYFIAHPAPIEYLINEIDSTLNVKATVEANNNQVASFESHLPKSIIEAKLEGNDLIILEPEELSEWI